MKNITHLHSLKDEAPDPINFKTPPENANKLPTALLHSFIDWV